MGTGGVVIADPFVEFKMSLEQKIIEMIDTGVDELREEAISLQRQFQMFGTHVKAKMDQNARGTLMVLVKARGKNTFEICWRKKQWIRLNNPKPGKSPWVLYSRYIKKGKSDHYEMKPLLSGAKDWEREMVPELEDGFAEIRRKLRCLMKCRQLLLEQSRRTERLAVSEKCGE